MIYSNCFSSFYTEFFHPNNLVYILYLDEEIDGDLLLKLSFEEIKCLFPKLKQRTLFMSEREKLSCKSFNEKIQSNSTPSDDDDQNDESLLMDENIKSADSIPFIQEVIIGNADAIPFNQEVVVGNADVSLSSSSINHSDDDANDDQLMKGTVKLQQDYELPPLPNDLKLVVDQKDLTKLVAHGYLRKTLLNLVYDDIANKRGLL